MRHFGSERMSDRWFDIKGELERLIESLEDAQPNDAETFSTLEGFKTQLKEMKATATEKLIKALEEEK